MQEISRRRPAEGRSLGNAARAGNPFVPADDAALVVEDNDSDVQPVKHRFERDLFRKSSMDGLLLDPFDKVTHDFLQGRNRWQVHE